MKNYKRTITGDGGFCAEFAQRKSKMAVISETGAKISGRIIFINLGLVWLGTRIYINWAVLYKFLNFFQALAIASFGQKVLMWLEAN